jgi:RNase P/RNase MRP subunit p30
MILATFASSESELRTPKELVSFGISIGMTRADAEKALDHMGKIISRQK